MELLNYIVENALILVPVLLIIGQMIKSTPKVADWVIPWALLALGIFGGCAIIGITVDGVIQGVLVAGAAVFGNQLWKQSQKGAKGEG